MKNFWHYMESVQEDREIEVQSEALFDFTVFTTSLSEIIVLGLVAMAGATWLGSTIKTWITEKLENITEEGAKKQIIGTAYTILNGVNEAIKKLPEEQKEEVLSKLKTMTRDEKRIFKQKMDKAIKDHPKFKTLKFIERKNILDVVIYGYIYNMSNIKLVDPKEKQKQKNSQPR